MTYTPTNWVAHETLISADRMNNIEQGIAGLYPQTQIVAPEQTVTITSETDPETGVPITLAEGIDLSTFSKENSLGFKVSINGESATFAGNSWRIDVDGGTALVIPVVDTDVGAVIGLSLSAANFETQVVLPGDYTVEIKRTVIETPMLGAFPVVAGEASSAPWVINASVDEVDVAKIAGCVLLYASRPNNRNGFAFGIVVGGLAYYAALTNGSCAWHAATVSVVGGKYAITAFV